MRKLIWSTFYALTSAIISLILYMANSTIQQIKHNDAEIKELWKEVYYLKGRDLNK